MHILYIYIAIYLEEICRYRPWEWKITISAVFFWRERVKKRIPATRGHVIAVERGRVSVLVLHLAI